MKENDNDTDTDKSLETLADLWFERFEDEGDACPSFSEMFPYLSPEKLNQAKALHLPGTAFRVNSLTESTGSGKATKVSDLSALKPGYRPVAGQSTVLVRCLGKGGFGQVWLAENAGLHKQSVLKFSARLFNETSIVMLRNEMAKLAKLDHPGIVKLLDEHLESAIPFLTYEYVGGETLDKVLASHFAKHGPLKPDEANGLIANIIVPLRYLHSQDPPIAHRDLKPGNILVVNSADLDLIDASGGYPDLRCAQLKLIDFGLSASARKGTASAAPQHSHGAKLHGGTPGYCSPQQGDGEESCTSDDVFSLGVIWYELLTGKQLQHAPSSRELRKNLAKLQVSQVDIDLIDLCVEPHRESRILIDGDNGLLKQMRRDDALPFFEVAISDACIALRGTLSESVNLAEVEFGPRGELTAGYLEASFALCSFEARSDHGTDTELTYYDVTSISLAAAKFLAEYSRSNELELHIGFPKLESLGPAVAEAFGCFHETPPCPWYGEFNGLKSLDVATAHAMSKRFKALSLNGIETLTEDSAKALSGISEINLDGLRSIDAKSLRYFVQTRNSISMEGLCRISLSTLRVLATASESGDINIPDAKKFYSLDNRLRHFRRLDPNHERLADINCLHGNPNFGDSIALVRDDVAYDQWGRPRNVENGVEMELHYIRVNLWIEAARAGNNAFFQWWGPSFYLGAMDEEMRMTPLIAAVESRQSEFLSNFHWHGIDKKRLESALDVSPESYFHALEIQSRNAGKPFNRDGKILPSPLRLAIQIGDEELVTEVCRAHLIADGDIKPYKP